MNYVYAFLAWLGFSSFAAHTAKDRSVRMPAWIDIAFVTLLDIQRLTMTEVAGASEEFRPRLWAKPKLLCSVAYAIGRMEKTQDYAFLDAFEEAVLSRVIRLLRLLSSHTLSLETLAHLNFELQLDGNGGERIVRTGEKNRTELRRALLSKAFELYILFRGARIRKICAEAERIAGEAGGVQGAEHHLGEATEMVINEFKSFRSAFRMDESPVWDVQSVKDGYHSLKFLVDTTRTKINGTGK